MTLTCKIQAVICFLVVILSITMCTVSYEGKKSKIEECSLMPGDCTVKTDEN